jgi:hypothetical protein
MANICEVKKGTAAVARYINHPCCEKCEHVEAGELAVAVFTETDTFGPVDWCAVCQACLDASEEELSLDQCHDCHEKVPNKDMLQWRWYDFYAPQGDEPLYICRSCWGKTPHQSRMEQDHLSLLEEEAQARARW